ncbi:MAG TPA: hypothetical protein VFF65_11325 [Phycisphaerales bacterium]|nr:hypothetical protein [Phycisphaerales bacterium]
MARKIRSDRKTPVVRLPARAARMGEERQRPVGRQGAEFIGEAGPVDPWMTSLEVAQRLTASGYKASRWSVNAWARVGVEVAGYPQRIRMECDVLPQGRRHRWAHVLGFFAAIKAATDLVAARKGGGGGKAVNAGSILRDVAPAVEEIRRRRAAEAVEAAVGMEQVRAGPAVRGGGGRITTASR